MKLQFKQGNNLSVLRSWWQNNKTIHKLGLPVATGILLAIPLTTLTVQAQQSLTNVTPQSTGAFKTFSSGIQGGTRITLSDHGNIIAHNSPFAAGRDYEHIGVGGLSEGYVLCYSGSNANDLGSFESGFGAAAISGNTATKISYTRNTLDGFLRLRQDFSFNGKLRSLTIDMTVTNPNGFTVPSVILRRQVDFDIDTGGAQGFANFSNWFGRTSQDGVFAWNDAGNNVPAGRQGHGLMLRNIQTFAGVGLPVAKVTSATLDSSCSPLSVVTPDFGDFGATLEYNLGSMAPFTSKKVTLIYERF